MAVGDAEYRPRRIGADRVDRGEPPTAWPSQLPITSPLILSEFGRCTEVGCLISGGQSFILKSSSFGTSFSDACEACGGRAMRRDGVRVNVGGGLGLDPRPLVLRRVPNAKISAEAGDVCCIRKKVWWSEQHRHKCRHADRVGDSKPYVDVSLFLSATRSMKYRPL